MKRKIVLESRVIEKVWGPDDTYLAVEVNTQVFEHLGFKKGDKVQITIEVKP